MHSLDDWELVARARTGDVMAFSALVSRYQAPVIHFCQRMVSSREDAEDLAQQCFVRLYKSLARLEPRAKFSTALFGIARNLTLNFLRDEKRRGRGKRQELPEAMPDDLGTRPDEQARRGELEERLHQELMQLSPQHREVLLLREFEGFDYENIARIVGCRKGTVRSRLARAREQLRQRLEASGGEWL